MTHLYGTQLPAGHAVSTVLASGDFETYSEAGYLWTGERWAAAKKGSPGIAAVGAWSYSAHPSTEVLVFRYDLKDGAGLRYWRPGQPNPQPLFDHLAAGKLFEAVNSFFEYVIWTNVCVRRYGWPALPLDQVRDVAAKAGAWTLPRKLEHAANVLETPERKDTEGHKIMLRVSKPRSPTKTDDSLRYTREGVPEDFEKLDAYCGDDVRAEDAVSLRCPNLSPYETRVFLADQAINVRGVRCDREAVDASLVIIDQAAARYNVELQHVTGGSVGTADELDKMKAWLLTQGVSAPEITKDTLPVLLAGQLPDAARRVLQIRELMGSLSVKKTRSMSLMMDPTDDRIRGLYTYAGAARTWRWSGAQVQPQNLPKDGPSVVRCVSCNTVHWSGLGYCPRCFGVLSKPAKWGIEAAEACIPALLTRSLDIVESLWGDALLAIAGCLRSFFIAAPGHVLRSSDLSSIEAVVIAELAGETWQQEVFRTHGKIYEMTASMITGVPFAEFARHKAETGLDHPQRALGKVASLASGFGGWVGAWTRAIDQHNLKATGQPLVLAEDEMTKHILAWRRKSPAIVALWKGLETAAIAAIENPGQCYQYRQLAYQMHANVLYCQLPSGRAIPYHAPRVFEEIRYDKPTKSIAYMGVDSQTKQWRQMFAWGAKLAEHVTQSGARDIFAAGIVRLEDAGYPVVLHTHDEPTCELPEGVGSVEEIERLMTVPLPWCPEWPVRASGGWSGDRYRKG